MVLELTAASSAADEALEMRFSPGFEDGENVTSMSCHQSNSSTRLTPLA